MLITVKSQVLCHHRNLQRTSPAPSHRNCAASGHHQPPSSTTCKVNTENQRHPLTQPSSSSIRETPTLAFNFETCKNPNQIHQPRTHPKPPQEQPSSSSPFSEPSRTTIKCDSQVTHSNLSVAHHAHHHHAAAIQAPFIFKPALRKTRNRSLHGLA
ncbi:hypothetical protein VIGAN_10101800 [Vigna angularis var. angularis]|uniref:Uncharacterized protein n=1 Tax=Vigna angularis var. angularis TaxID=157739 RepID=A0A0S3T337_PHAAN|nr:hypothetical protein VIGAN_10101800 [Vigna angularis var. angularis]